MAPSGASASAPPASAATASASLSFSAALSEARQGRRIKRKGAKAVYLEDGLLWRCGEPPMPFVPQRADKDAKWVIVDDETA